MPHLQQKPFIFFSEESSSCNVKSFPYFMCCFSCLQQFPQSHPSCHTISGTVILAAGPACQEAPHTPHLWASSSQCPDVHHPSLQQLQAGHGHTPLSRHICPVPEVTWFHTQICKRIDNRETLLTKIKLIWPCLLWQAGLKENDHFFPIHPLEQECFPLPYSITNHRSWSEIKQTSH